MRMVGRYTGLSVTGLTEALRVLPATFAMLRRLVRAARETRPDVLVLVDYPDFNFRLMAAMARAGVPIVYYVTPQVWAWRAGRMKTLAAPRVAGAANLPVRGAALPGAPGIPVRFLGHPLVDAVPAPPADPAAAAALQAARRIDLGLDAGSADGGAAARQPPQRDLAARAGAGRGPATRRRARAWPAGRGGLRARPSRRGVRRAAPRPRRPRA